MIYKINLPDREIELNENQQDYFSVLFNDDLTIRMDNNFNEFGFFGGWRCGKSFCQQFSTYLISCKYPGARGLYVRDTYKQLQDSVIYQYNRDFERYKQYEYKKTDREAHFANGSIIHFRAFDTDTNIFSNEYDWIASCQTEDISEGLFLNLFGRLSGKVLPKPLLFSEGNPANTFVKPRYKDRTAEELLSDNIFFIEGPTTQNIKNLPEGYLDKLKKTLPKALFRRYVEGGWDSIDEMVFADFREEQHIIDPIDPQYISANFKKCAGGDYGYRNPASFVWMYRDYDGNIIIYDEWYETEQNIDEIARASQRHGSQYIAYDFSTKRPDRDGKSVWTELEKYGVRLIESNKDEMANINRINSFFKQNKIFITRNCVNLIKEIRGYKWKRLKLGANQNEPEEPVDKDNHAIDAMLYGVAYMEDFTSKEPEEIPYHKTLQARTIRRSTPSIYNKMG